MGRLGFVGLRIDLSASGLGLIYLKLAPNGLGVFDLSPINFGSPFDLGISLSILSILASQTSRSRTWALRSRM